MAQGISGRPLLHDPFDMPRGTDYQGMHISVRTKSLYVALRRPVEWEVFSREESKRPLVLPFAEPQKIRYPTTL